MKRWLNSIKATWLFVTLLFNCCGAEGFRVEINLPQATGLKKGSQVRYRGVPVGEVEQVVLRRTPDGRATQAIATLVIREKQVVLRESDTFRLATAGLTGEGYIDIDPGPSGSPPLRPDSTVEATTPPTIPLTDAKGLSSFFGLLELTTRMNRLPPERRDAILKEFHLMVEKALEEQDRAAATPATSGTRR